MNRRKGFKAAIPLIALLIATLTIFDASRGGAASPELLLAVSNAENGYIKWIDFTPTADALSYASLLDRKYHKTARHLRMYQLLAIYSARHGGDYGSFNKSALDVIAEKYQSGIEAEEMVQNKKLLAYYMEAYEAVLGAFIGDYQVMDSEGRIKGKQEYGLRVFSPIARNYGYSHYDDFGASRSYGYKRSHLGHDIMGSIGTPIIAVEGGYVEACGWNQYGGWRIGIRSFDGKRYYYYAHLRKGHPYNDIYEGKTVNAGEVIGYLGMTGYSAKQDTNNINTPHLHYGMQIIFDKSQKDGSNQIWIDMYEITKFLYIQRSAVVLRNKDYYSVSSLLYPEAPD